MTPQPTFNLRHPDETRPRVDRLEPAAPDGKAWRDQVIALAYSLCREGAGTTLTPSALRAAADGLGLVPYHPAAWGSLWGRLHLLGWTRTGREVVAKTASRNAAREDEWAPPGAAS